MMKMKTAKSLVTVYNRSKQVKFQIKDKDLDNITVIPKYFAND